MKTTTESTQKKEDFGIGTMALANVCNNCGICAFANKKPKSGFAKLMAWHRNWCPARLAHNKVYGKKRFTERVYHLQASAN